MSEHRGTSRTYILSRLEGTHPELHVKVGA